MAQEGQPHSSSQLLLVVAIVAIVAIFALMVVQQPGQPAQTANPFEEAIQASEPGALAGAAHAGPYPQLEQRILNLLPWVRRNPAEACQKWSALEAAKRQRIEAALSCEDWNKFAEVMTCIAAKNCGAGLPPTPPPIVQQPSVPIAAATTPYGHVAAVGGANTNDRYCGPGESIGSSNDCYCIPGEDRVTMADATGEIDQLCIGGIPVHACGDGLCRPAHGENSDTCARDCAEVCSANDFGEVDCDALLKLGSNVDTQLRIRKPDSSIVRLPGWPSNAVHWYYYRGEDDIQGVVKHGDTYVFRFMPNVEVPMECMEDNGRGALVPKRPRTPITLIDGTSTSSSDYAKVTISHKKACDIGSAIGENTRELELIRVQKPCEKILQLLDRSTMPTNAPTTCGDLYCNGNIGENEQNCLADCFYFTTHEAFFNPAWEGPTKCGNSQCEWWGGETHNNCRKDCMQCEGDYVCAMDNVRPNGLFGFSEGADCLDCVEGAGNVHAINHAAMQAVASCIQLKGQRFARYQKISDLIQQPGAWQKLLFRP